MSWDEGYADNGARVAFALDIESGNIVPNEDGGYTKVRPGHLDDLSVKRRAEADNLRGELLNKNAALFTAGELMWLMFNPSPVPFVGNVYVGDGLEMLRALKATVEEREAAAKS